jgi:non-heme chloroperoxidase
MVRWRFHARWTSSRVLVVLVSALSLLAVMPRTCLAGLLEVDDDVKLYYEEQGSGSPIVFVHGWTASGAAWAAQAAYFSKEHRVITLDLRSHGNSSKPLQGNTIPQFARDVKRLLDKLGARDVVLVGWSMGVDVVLDYYKQFGPSNLKGLGLVDMTPCSLCADAWNSQMTPDVLGQFAYAMQADRRAWFAQFNKLLWKVVPPANVEEAFYRGTTMTPTVVALSLAYDFVYRDYRSVLPMISLPTIIFAANSGLFPKGIETGQYVHASIPESRLVIFENAAHMIPMEDSQRFNQELENFVRSLK